MLRAAYLTVLGSTAAFLACTDTATNPREDQTTDQSTLAALLVSDVLPITAAALGGTTAEHAASEVSYVSLPPGTLTDIIAVRIRNVTAGGAPTPEIGVVEGGFDPVAIVASEGDRLELAFTEVTGTVSYAAAKVPVRRPPALVRTSPPRGRTDVALSIWPTIIFSEPVDPGTLAPAVRLLRGGTPVGGSVHSVSGQPWAAEFVPQAALQPLTTYELVITQNVRDLVGDPLEAPVTVTFTTGPVLDPSIAFASTRDGSPQIYVANADGSAATWLTTGERPSWSPDGRRILFERGRSRSGGPYPQGAHVYVVNADGSNEIRLRQGMEPGWSPDGTRIVFVDSAGISVMNDDGSGVVKLIRHDVALSAFPGFYVGAPAWSPDGASIAFDHANEFNSQQIYLMNADGSAPRRLTTDELGMQGAECKAAWSPDGSRVAIWSWLYGIATINAAGSASGLYKDFPAVSCFSRVDWSPDGEALVFNILAQRDDQEWTSRIFVMDVIDARAGAPRRLIADVVAPVLPTYSDYDPAWSRAQR